MFNRLFGSRPSANKRNVISGRAPRNTLRVPRTGSALHTIAKNNENIENISEIASTLPAIDENRSNAASAAFLSPRKMAANNDSMSIMNTDPSIFSQTSSAFPNALTTEEDIVIPFYKIMSTDAKAHFKPQIDQIRLLLKEMKGIIQGIGAIQTPLKNITKELQTIKLNSGNTSFRGKNAPTLYVSPTANGSDAEARINFMVNGYPMRVRHPSSFNTVLASMKQKTRTLRSKTGPLRKAIAVVKQKQAAYDAKQREVATLLKKLQKDHEEYAAAHAKMVRGSRKTYQPGLGPQSLTLAAAESALATPARSRFSLFGKRGGTRRRSISRKTRKNRK